jgi:UDP:flavonoid glycosyltransferase YjiC (YdhE family)
MSKIALTWELGDNYGHVAKLVLLAKSLVMRGHEVVAMLRDITLLDSTPTLEVLQAPVWPQESRGFAEPPLSYPEILLRFGYHDAASLQRLSDGWCKLIELWKPDLVVADNAPTALLAARINGIPAAVIGEGFTIPPQLTPMPNMRPWLNVPLDRLIHSDTRVAEVINTVLAKHGNAPLRAVSELFSSVERFIFTLAELDHYPLRKGERYWGPQYYTDGGIEAVWPQGGRGRVFVNLRPQHRDFMRIMELLDAMDFNVIASVPHLTDHIRGLFNNPRMLLSDQHYRLAGLGCDFAITYGGHGTTSALLMSGIPQLMFPTHLEQHLLATRIEQLGAGIAVNYEAPASAYGQLLRKMRDAKVYEQTAQAFAASQRGYDCGRQMEDIVSQFERLIF